MPALCRLHGGPGSEFKYLTALARAKADYQTHPDPSFLTYGPKTRRQVLSLARLGGH
ncbi:MAG: hypothetical protein IH996_08595 [Proteobacteria bacterium]|nr:hypothetical protein [Pseudomonadota bacterium]